MVLNLNHNIEKIIDGNPSFFCFSTASWFSKILSWFSKIFHSTLLSLAHRNFLFHVILVHHHLDQVPRYQAINSNSFDLYFYCSPCVSFSCSHRSYKRNKNKVFEFFLLRLRLFIWSVWKFLFDLSQFGNSLACCKYAVCENLLKGSRINRNNLSLEYIFLTFRTLGSFFFAFTGKLVF